MKETIDYSLILRKVERNGWSRGISMFLDSLPAKDAIDFGRLLRNRLASCKLFFDLSGEKALVMDTGLGFIVDSFTQFFSKVFCIDSNLEKLKLITLRNRQKNSKVICICNDDFFSLPFKDCMLDAIFITDLDALLKKSLVENATLLKLLLEFYRILNSNGSLFFIYHHNKTKKIDKETIGKLLFKAHFTTNEKLLLSANSGSQIEMVFNDRYKYITNTELGVMRRGSYFVKNNLLYPFFASSLARLTYKNIKPKKNTLEKIVFKIAEITNTDLFVDKILLQSSTIVFLRNYDKGHNGFIVRIPYDESSLKRCVHNFEALQYIFSNKQNFNIKCPTAVLQDKIDGINFFAESLLDGYSIDRKCRYYTKVINECQIISQRFFFETNIDINSNIKVYEELIDSLIEILKSPYLQQYEKDIDILYNYLIEFFYYRLSKGCLCHGDFKCENVLFNKSISPVGIIDWDLFMKNGIPLLDIIHTLCRRRIIYNKGLDVIKYINEILLRWKLDKIENKIIDNYMEIVGINKEIIFPALIIYWLHHINIRQGFYQIKIHKKWFDYNVINTLENVMDSIKFKKLIP